MLKQDARTSPLDVCVYEKIKNTKYKQKWNGETRKESFTGNGRKVRKAGVELVQHLLLGYLGMMNERCAAPAVPRNSLGWPKRETS